MQINKLLALLLMVSVFTLISTTAPAEPADPPEMKTSELDNPRGQLLYETHCGVCHDQSVHSRNPRKADSIDKIKYFVTRWSTELKLNWSATDINAVAQYLNSRFYKFEE